MRQWLLLVGLAAMSANFALAAESADQPSPLPRPLESYADPANAGVLGTLKHRMAVEPFNAVASLIFVLAICHTFLTSKFRHLAHEAEEAHAKRIQSDGSARVDDDGEPVEVSFKGQVFHFLGEVEAVFGIWALALVGAIVWFFGWGAVTDYVGHRVNFTEPMFVVVIMAIAGTRPVLRISETCMRLVSSLGGGSASAWWLSILMVAPLLGSFITEPAAMTIAALLLAQKFYALKPSARFAYGTLGLLFVNISVGGTLTHFAAPPVLMVAAPWGWTTPFMLVHFGWKAAIGIAVSTLVYFAFFRRELRRLDTVRLGMSPTKSSDGDRPVPAWITVVQLSFLAFTVAVAHYPPLFIGGFLFFLAFTQATAHHQGKLDLKAPMLVGFFLAGLVVHGGLQGWWIEPVLKSLTEIPLFIGATALTALNDNAAITYLATLVPGFTDELKYAVVAGAVTGGGLTVIANAPNPAGYAILRGDFDDGAIHPLGLLAAALPATLVAVAAFRLL